MSLNFDLQNLIMLYCITIQKTTVQTLTVVYKYFNVRKLINILTAELFFDQQVGWLGFNKAFNTCKSFPYSLPSVGPGADPGVHAVSPQVT